MRIKRDACNKRQKHTNSYHTCIDPFMTATAYKTGGGGGIRTPGGVAPTQPFQGCTIDHSDTPPIASFVSSTGARSGTRTRTYSRIADFESAAAAITPPWRADHGAGEGNRTLVASLEGWSSAIELRPLTDERDIVYHISCPTFNHQPEKSFPRKVFVMSRS